MSTHNIQFHDKIRKFPLVFVFLSYRKNFVGTQKRVRINHGKQAIGVRAIDVRLYFVANWLMKFCFIYIGICFILFFMVIQTSHILILILTHLCLVSECPSVR